MNLPYTLAEAVAARTQRRPGADWPYLSPPPAPEPPRWYVGLDLGQSADFSALVAVERHKEPNPNKAGATQWRFDVRHLQRWPLKTPYPQIVADTKAMFAEGSALHKQTLVVDATGVGRPVVDMFRTADIAARMIPLAITCGSAVTGTTVAKKELVGAVQAPLCSGRLRFADGLELTPVLVQELQNFRVTVDEQTRNESFAAWRSSSHDDLVLALALALHVASRDGGVYVGVVSVGGR